MVFLLIAALVMVSIGIDSMVDMAMVGMEDMPDTADMVDTTADMAIIVVIMAPTEEWIHPIRSLHPGVNYDRPTYTHSSGNG